MVMMVKVIAADPRATCTMRWVSISGFSFLFLLAMLPVIDLLEGRKVRKRQGREVACSEVIDSDLTTGSQYCT